MRTSQISCHPGSSADHQHDDLWIPELGIVMSRKAVIFYIMQQDFLRLAVKQP